MMLLCPKELCIPYLTFLRKSFDTIPDGSNCVAFRLPLSVALDCIAAATTSSSNCLRTYITPTSVLVGFFTSIFSSFNKMRRSATK